MSFPIFRGARDHAFSRAVAVATVVVLLLVSSNGRAQAPNHPPTAAADSTAVIAVIDRYHEALARGDSVLALSLLASDAVILESGALETREEYRGHHLPGDIAFARAVQRERGPIGVTVRGDVAWTSTLTRTRGEYKGRAIDSAGAELIVLSREPDGWKIRAIHWSSRPKRAAS